MRLLTILTFFLFASNSSLNYAQDSLLYIAYNVLIPNTHSNYDIFTMDLEGNQQKNITRHPDVAWTYDAYENRLFFISDRDTCYRCYFLYETDVNGKNIKKISSLQLEDSWMSSRNEGKEIVVAGRIGKKVRYQLFLINTLTGSFHQITHDTAAYFSDPCFSPDGSQIVFVHKPRKRDPSSWEEIYIMNSNGSGEMRQLTWYPKDDSLQTHNGYKAGPPRWNAKDNFISYQSLQAGKYSLYAVNPEGTKQWKLTSIEHEEGWHDWSPDGKWLVIEIFDPRQDQFHIARMNWESKEFRILSDDKFKYQQAPVFLKK